MEEGGGKLRVRNVGQDMTDVPFNRVGLGGVWVARVGCGSLNLERLG